jgi:hypothetical protein
VRWIKTHLWPFGRKALWVGLLCQHKSLFLCGAKLLVLDGIGRYPGTELPEFDKTITDFVSSLKK